MATVQAVVCRHHKKKDGTFNVKIRVFHKGVRRMIPTHHFLTQKQLDKDYKIKDRHILKLLNETLYEYRKKVSDVAGKLDLFSITDLSDHLKSADKEIDFIKFCDRHIAKLKKEGREGTANTHRTVRNTLVDFFKRDTVSIREISYNMLIRYCDFLKTSRKITRINQLGNEVVTHQKGVTNNGVHNYSRDLRTLFNAACRYYNDEDLGILRISHNPFKKFKIGSAPLTRKRNVTIDQLMAIRDCQTKADSRAEMAKELFMLSFYLCGMNAVDIYNLERRDILNGRIEYCRSKTANVRKDNAFISIKLIPEALLILAKYLGKLKLQYSNHNGLDSALSKGMKDLRDIAGIPGLTFYWARHTFATLARNKCRMSKDDLALALNHVDEGHRTTDIYIEKDWSIVDEVQSNVVELLRGHSPMNMDNVRPLWR